MACKARGVYRSRRLGSLQCTQSHRHTEHKIAYGERQLHSPQTQRISHGKRNKLGFDVERMSHGNPQHHRMEHPQTHHPAARRHRQRTRNAPHGFLTASRAIPEGCLCLHRLVGCDCRPYRHHMYQL